LIRLLLLFALLFLLVPVPDLEWSWIIVILSLLFLSTLLNTCSDAMMSEYAKPPSAERFSSLYTLSADLGSALGPIWAYLWLNQHGGTWLITIVGSSNLLMLALLWLVRFKEREVSHVK
jgi:predicted MFS family arabinose efflux permease